MKLGDSSQVFLQQIHPHWCCVIVFCTSLGMGPTLHFGWLVICYCPGAFTAYFIFNDTHLGFLSHFVALNIAIADTEEDSCEASILKYLTGHDAGIGSQHIVELLDHF